MEDERAQPKLRNQTGPISITMFREIGKVTIKIRRVNFP